MASRSEILLGKIALQRGFVSKEQIQDAIRYQEADAAGTHLGELLVTLGLIDKDQLIELLDAQNAALESKDTRTGLKRGDILFGRRVIDQNLATKDQVNQCIRLQEKYREAGKNVTLGQIMVESSILTAAQVTQVLQSQRVETLGCSACGKSYNIRGYDESKTYGCPACKTPLNAVTDSQVVRVVAPPPASDELALAPASEAPVIVKADDGPRIGEGPARVKPIVPIPPEESEDDLCGTTIGGYQILKKLGQGGMGVIYKALQLSLDRTVALKMLNDELAGDEVFLGRFVNEAKSVARLNHPNIVQIYDVSESDGRHFFSMEYVPGENVGDMLDRAKRIPIQQSVEIMIQICHALIEAGHHRIVHRDIKPDNIMISLKNIAKLADLGIARSTDVQKDMRITDSQIAIGTPYYISPEQAQDPTSVDQRADIYSLGASLYHMLCGRVPFYGVNPAVIFMKLAKEEPPDPLKFNPLLPYRLVQIVLKMMAKKPHERQQSPQELLKDFEEILAELKDPSKKSKPTLRMSSEMLRIDATEADTSGLMLSEEVAQTPDPPPLPPPEEGDPPSGPRPASGPRATQPSALRRSSVTIQPVKKYPIGLFMLLAALVCIGGIAGAIALRDDGKEEGPVKPPETGPSAAEIATKEARSKLDALRKRMTEARDPEATRLVRADIESFIGSLDASTAGVRGDAQRLLDQTDQRIDTLLVEGAEKRARTEAGLGGARTDFRKARALLEAVRPELIGASVGPRLDKVLGDLELASQAAARAALASAAGVEKGLEGAATTEARQEILGRALGQLEDVAARVLPDHVADLEARRAALDTFASELEARLAHEASIAHHKRGIEALVEVLPALAMVDGEAARAHLATVFDAEENLSVADHRLLAEGALEAGQRALEALEAAVGRLVEGQIAFRFEKAHGGADIEVKRYTRMKPEDGIKIYSREPASVIFVARLTDDCLDRLLGDTMDLQRPADRASIAFYLLIHGEDRRQEALVLLDEASKADPTLRPLAFAFRLGGLREAIAGAADPKTPSAEREALWTEAAERFAAVGTDYAGTEFLEAFAAELATAERRVRDRR